jgi:drug/metabolite transporter (DMT)-like permease
MPSLARYRDAGLFVLLAVLFGGSFVAIKTGLRELPPLLFAGLRFDIGAVVLGGYVVATRARSAWLPRTRRDLLGIGVGGLFLIAANNALLFAGQGTTTPAMASIIFLQAGNPAPWGRGGMRHLAVCPTTAFCRC